MSPCTQPLPEPGLLPTAIAAEGLDAYFDGGTGGSDDTLAAVRTAEAH